MKNLSRVIILAAAFCAMLALASCGHTHTPGEWIIDTEATCTVDGAKHSVCSDCGETAETVTIPATGHDEVENEAKTPTCTEVGWDAYVSCTKCDYTTCVEKPELGHEFDGGLCTRCGGKRTSTGLRFTANEDGTTCYVSGIGSCKDAVIVIPETSPSGKAVTGIGRYAFEKCSSIVSVTIPASITSIEPYAFDGCYKLVEVINESELNIVKGSTANGMVGYYALTVDATESEVVAVDDYLFYTYEHVNYLLGYTGSDTELILPESYNEQVYGIYDCAFYDRGDITGVILPACLTGIGSNAFYYCNSLTTLIIPGAVESIGVSAFWGCSSLTFVVFETYSGWWRALEATATDGTTLLTGHLSNTEKAAKMLTSEYYNYYWKRT